MDSEQLKYVYSDEYTYLREMGIEGDKLRKTAVERTQKAIAEHVLELVDVTNSSALDCDEIAEGIYNGITKGHRYLQNEFWIAMGKVIEKYANMEKGYYDGRNEWAVKDCRIMSDAIDKDRGIEKMHTTEYCPECETETDVVHIVGDRAFTTCKAA